MKNSTVIRMRIEKDIVTVVKRTLKGRGNITVSVGQEVTPEDLIGTSSISSGFRTINLAELLSVSPSQVSKYLKKQINQRVYKDELLAYKDGGFFQSKKIVVSPADGVLDFLNPDSGEVRMSFLPKKVNLPAGVYGIIEVVDKERGQVVIKTQVSRIHGLLGTGRVRDGSLIFVGRKDSLLSKESIPPRFEGHIIVGGSLIYKDGISASISSGVSGIITGGINAKDYRGMAGGRLVPNKLENDIGISIVCCEGFGSIPIGDDIYNLLRDYDGKFISMDGNKGLINLPSFESKSIIRVKQTHLPKLESSEEDEQSSLTDKTTYIGELKLGQMARVIGNSYLGEQGKIISIDKTDTILPTGLGCQFLTLETKRRKIKVPVANIEVMDYSP